LEKTEVRMTDYAGLVLISGTQEAEKNTRKKIVHPRKVRA
jgi:hypothetical protein